MLKRCELCPRKCRVDRTAGETGFCGLPADIVLDCHLAHHGEEPPLSGTRGAGTIFLSSCNLKCIYCQNYQISHTVQGRRLQAADLAAIMLSLQERGCHNVEPVTPTPQTPAVMDALVMARAEGLTVPFVYNCSGYENPEVVKLLAGLVEIYLPDFKYGLDETGRSYSGVDDYVENCVASLREMLRQTGEGGRLRTDRRGVAVRGVIIRHLVLPDEIDNSLAVLDLIRQHVSTDVSLCIMSQYTPIPSVRKHPRLGRRVTRREYETVVNYALDIGFEELFTQQVDDTALTPDFRLEEPFDFDK